MFPGSARAVHDPSNLFVPVVSAFIRRVLDHHPNIKLFGSCFGHQIFGHALGGKTGQMTDIPSSREKIIGRELIKPTDAFFQMPCVQKYLKEHGEVPPIVLQQSHGDQVETLPPQAVLLGTSESCKNEMFAVGTRLLCMQAHPDFNQAVQQEINAAEYLIAKVIKPSSFPQAWLAAQRHPSEHRESRNMVHALIRNFLDA